MRVTRQAALAIALICGLLAAVLAYVWIGQQSKPAEKAPETVQVPVPISKIPTQTDLQPTMFKQVTMERAKVPANAIVSDQAFVGRISLSELAPDQPVLDIQVAQRTKALGLAYGIARGQRAESIALDIVGAVTDFVQPGNRVDVMVSYQKDGKTVIKTVIQDVLVLAQGISTNPAPPAGAAAAPVPGAAPVKTENAPPKRPEMPYTLAVTPAQAQIVYLADEAGDLRLTLRGIGDHEILPLPPANSWTMIGPIPKDGNSGGASAPSATAATPQPTPQAAPRPVPQVAAAAPAYPVAPQAPRKPSVEIIRGGQRETVVPD
jgi:pilus assembly protein CpaB